MESRTCFLLTHSWRDLDNRLEITIHARTIDGVPLIAVIDHFRPLFFVPRTTPAQATQIAAERLARNLTALDHTPLDCLYFNTVSAQRKAAETLRIKGVRVFETDLPPVERYLMERLVKGTFLCEGVFETIEGVLQTRNPRIRGVDAVPPVLRVLSLDIETNAATNEIYSIALSGISDRVFIVGMTRSSDTMVCCTDEHQLLRAFLAQIAIDDPDVIIGWSIEDFDLRVLQERCAFYRIPFTLGRRSLGRVLPPRQPGGNWLARIPGRLVMDVPVMLRASFRNFQEWSLDFVAHEMLGKGKLIHESGEEKIAEINRLFRMDKPALARYNLEDAKLTKEIFDKAGILADAVQRSRLSGQLPERPGGSVAAFDYLYLPLLHRAGFVAGDLIDAPLSGTPLMGGWVMEPAAGLYENVLVLDFRSLYPSIIMTFKIDPLGLVTLEGERITGPTGISFAKSPAILPGIIEQLMAARQEAKQIGNPHLSLAIKILMNSFYGVLGSQGCRFFSPTLAESITRTGQFILKTTAARIEEFHSLRILYGDTDSLFVLLGPGTEKHAEITGRELVASVNRWLGEELATRFGVTSALLLQFETHFRHFFLPTTRGGEQGSKKHYCGAHETDKGLELNFTGMESVRTDWTEMAKEFQHELILKLFRNQPIDDYIRQTVAMVRAGRCDTKLTYRKRLRKRLDEYAGAAPPHVQAARLLPKPGTSISYVITTDGPQPSGMHHAPLDYDHYVDAQLRPIADTILQISGKKFDEVVSGQISLFT